MMHSIARRLSHWALGNERGSASIELMVIVPVAALFLLIVFQFSMLFSDVVRDVADANTRASITLREWEVQNAQHGFIRPCLEKMENTAFKSESSNHRIGAGMFSYEFTAPQEVRVVSSEICIP